MRYDRDVVIVNTLRVTRLFVIDEERQVICLPGSSLCLKDSACSDHSSVHFAATLPRA